MSLADPLSLTYNTVAKDCVQVREDNYMAEYFFRDTANDMTFKAVVSHTMPDASGTKESHSIKVDVVEFDAATGLSVVEHSCWLVFKTFKGAQSANATYVVQALVDYLTDANINKILARES